MRELVLTLDLGGQYTELIARTVRGLSLYSEIRQGNIPADEVKRLSPVGSILTSGPNSVYLPDPPECDPEIFNLGVPILGIRYGMQMMCRMLGVEVLPCERGEYGIVFADLDAGSVLSQDAGARNAVLMSHKDCITGLPDGFVNTGKKIGSVSRVVYDTTSKSPATVEWE